MQTITVKPTSNAKGTPQRIARGMGKQRTFNVDLSKSDDWNLGAAAGVLGKVLGWQPGDRLTGDGNTVTNHDR